MKKYLISLLLLLSVTALLLLPVAAEDAPQYLVDDGELLTESEAAAVSDALRVVSTKHGVSVVVVTTPTLYEATAEEFADDYFDYNGYGKDGLLLLVCPNEDVRYLSTSGKAIDWFAGDNFTKLTDAIIPYLDDSAYQTAFFTYAATCSEIIEDETAFPWIFVVIAIVLGLALSAIIPMKIYKGELKSVRAKANAADYTRSGSMNLTESRDIFLYHTVTRTAKPKSDSDRGTHTGSSGNTHGGGSF